MKTYHVLIALIIFVSCNSSAQKVEEFELNDTWIQKIATILPKSEIPVNSKKKQVLIFSLHTGFKHWTIPHTEKVMQLLAENSGNYEVTCSKDIGQFEKQNLKKYDVVVLNNTCSIGDKRNLFWDVIKEDENIDDDEKLNKANQLEKNLIQFVKSGNGLMLMHGAIVMQNKSEAFGNMVGGSFDYHPKQQTIQVIPTDPTHPLVAHMPSEGFSHYDEPYLFKGAYEKLNFRPLLQMETKHIEGLRDAVKESVLYISWIKKHGKGRVFYSSPSHNAQSMENPDLLKFFLNGLDYAAGNLSCDDSPMK